MTFVPINVPPGVVKTKTGESVPGRWFDANNVRFLKGKPRKRAGCQAINTVQLSGKARGMEAWNKINGDPLYAVGTHLKLYGSTDGKDVINITPLRFPQSWASKLSTTVNLGAITVTMTAHGFVLGKLFKVYGNSFQGGSAVGGILIGGIIWELVKVVDANNFKIYPASPTGTLGANPFTTVNTSTTVTVAHTAHGRATGDTVWIAGAAAVNGITPDGDYQITVVNVNSYTIVHSAPATGNGTGGGAAVTYHYSKPATSTVALGGGVVPYYTYLTNAFTTTNLSADVTVNHTGHGASKGDTLIVSGAAAVSGITISGEYTIKTITDADHFVITHSAAANANATGGGSATLIEYELSIGLADRVSSALRGFGTGALGSGFFGASGPANTSTYFDPRTWAIDNLGEDAIATPLSGTIYYWDSSAAGRADAIQNAPTGLRYAFMTEERHIIALGINGDGLVMGWCSQGVFDDWTATSTNTANSSRRVREGSTLIAGVSAGGGMNLVWTDTACYEHQYTGSRFIYDTRLSASRAGLMSPQAFAKTPLGVMWMSQTSFVMWAGAVRGIPNAADIETWVYENIDPGQKDKTNAHYDPINNSVDFYFVPMGGSEPDWYVSVNLDDFSWVNGIEMRTTGASFQRGKQSPIRVNNGKVYEHEIGLDNDGVAAESHLTMAPYDIQGRWSDFFGFDPDFKTQIGDVTLTMTSYDRNPNTTLDTETETFGPDDEIVDFRGEGRHISLSLSQTLLGGDWELGTPQIDAQPAGERR